MHLGVLFDWLAGGMGTPVDVAIRVLLDATLRFVVEGMADTPTGAPDCPK